MEKGKQQEKSSIFSHVELTEVDPIMGLKYAYENDTSALKINLGIGGYVDAQGKPYVFKVVRKAQQIILSQNHHHQYLFRDGLKQFIEGTKRVSLGNDNPILKQNRIASIHSIAGTGALSVAFTFIQQYRPGIIYVSDPTWVSHKPIIQHHRLKWVQYPYYSHQRKALDFQSMKDFFVNTAVSGSYVLFQTSAHNPTGFDLNKQQWIQIASTIKNKSLIPIFDSAYQGCATGNINEDSWSVQYFASQGFQMFITQSFSKNLGLYSERVGALHIVVKDSETANNILSQLKDLVRNTYTSPAKYGALVAATIFNNELLYQEWEDQLRQVVVGRIKHARKLLKENLEQIEVPGPWDHIVNQIGMFSYSGLSRQVVKLLGQKYHIYILYTGRMNIAGINQSNVKYLAQSIKQAMQEVQNKNP